MTAVGPRQPRPCNNTYATVDISTAADGLSDIINVEGLTLTSVQIGANWTTAQLAYLGNCDGSTNMYELRVSSSVGSSVFRHHVFVSSLLTFASVEPFYSLKKLQLASIATASTAVAAQGATRTITLGLTERT